MWLAALIFACAVSGAASSDSTHGDLVDINRASVAELMHVPGMTESWAGRIVRFRPYWTKFDLLQEGVVTEEVYRRIRPGIIAHHMANEN